MFVVEAEELASHPEATLRVLCESMSVSFDPAMLSWDPGPKVGAAMYSSDGIGAMTLYCNDLLLVNLSQ